jgi:pimeloyl-[acyl-carrier protein] synthase
MEKSNKDILKQFEPESLSFRADPYPIYKWFQEHSPVHYREEYDDWIITSYEDVKKGLENPLLRPPAMEKPIENVNVNWEEILSIKEDSEKLSIIMEKIEQIKLQNIFNLSPPYHTHIRTILNPLFSLHSVEKLKIQMQDISKSLINKKLQLGKIDIINDYALPFVTSVFFSLVGLPYSDVQKLYKLSETFILSKELSIKDPHIHLKLEMSFISFINYLYPILLERKKNLKDDIISNLLINEMQGKITFDGVLGIMVSLLIGGFETTISAISLAVYCLSSHPSQTEKLKKNVSLIQTAVDELLRFSSPGQSISLVATDSFKIKNYLIQKGHKVHLIIGAANRDPKKFDNPDELDITRKPNQHLSFGAGNHYCIGVSLARLEMEVAISSLFSLLNNFELLDFEWLDTYNIRGFRKLIYRFC